MVMAALAAVMVSLALAPAAPAAGPIVQMVDNEPDLTNWHFDPAQTMAVRVAGLPLEEYAFFLVIPLAGILTYEAVGVARERHRRRR